MHRLSAILAGLLAALTVGSAEAALGHIEDAYELALDQIQLPGQPTGALVLRTCPACPPVSLRVTAATTWHAGTGTRPVSQAEVLRQVRAAAARPGVLVYVYYQPRTRVVNRVVLDNAAAGGRP